MTPIDLYRLPTITYTPAQTATDVCVYTLIPTAIAFRSITVFKQLISTSFKIEFQQKSLFFNCIYLNCKSKLATSIVRKQLFNTTDL